jgi:hypothetical protein
MKPLAMQNCVDIVANRTQYLVVVTLLPQEMGQRFEIQALYELQGKNSPGGISCQQRKRQRKRKRNINQERGCFSLKVVSSASREKHLPRGFFLLAHPGTRRKVPRCNIWVVPEGWW